MRTSFRQQDFTWVLHPPLSHMTCALGVVDVFSIPQIHNSDICWGFPCYDILPLFSLPRGGQLQMWRWEPLITLKGTPWKTPISTEPHQLLFFHKKRSDPITLNISKSPQISFDGWWLLHWILWNSKQSFERVSRKAHIHPNGWKSICWVTGPSDLWTEPVIKNLINYL